MLCLGAAGPGQFSSCLPILERVAFPSRGVSTTLASTPETTFFDESLAVEKTKQYRFDISCSSLAAGGRVGVGRKLFAVVHRPSERDIMMCHVVRVYNALG